VRVFAVLLAFAADLAWNFAGAFWGFTLLALLVLAVALNQAHITTGSKAYRTEERLNAVMPRIPNPQTRPGNQTMTAGGVTDTSYNASGGLVDDVNTSQNDVQSADAWQPAGGFRGGIAYYNDLRNSYSNSVATNHGNVAWVNGPFVDAYNALRGSHATLLADHNQLQNDHFNLEQAHNGLLTTLTNANLLQ
jgi:hypothetical protein